MVTNITFEVLVLDVLAAEIFRERMAQQLACAELPLRWAFSRLRFHDAFLQDAHSYASCAGNEASPGMCTRQAAKVKVWPTAKISLAMA